MGQSELVFWGHATFEFVSRGKRLLLDPFITKNDACPESLDHFRDVDYIVVSHAAWDHMGDAAQLAAGSEGITVVAAPDVAAHLEEEGVPRSRIVTGTYGKRLRLDPFEIQVLECKHISFNRKARLTGIPLSFIIYPEPRLGVYASCDTAIFSDLRLFGELYRPSVGLIHMGTFPGKASTLSPLEGVLMTRWLGLNAVVPCHYTAESAEPGQFRELLAQQMPDVRYQEMQPGQRLSLADLAAR